MMVYGRGEASPSLVSGPIDVSVDEVTVRPPSRSILGMRVDATSYPDAARRIMAWAKRGQSGTVFVATVNNVMEAHDDERFLRVMNEADLVTPDGMPLVWGLRWLGLAGATRVYGPDLTPLVLGLAEAESDPRRFLRWSPERPGRSLPRGDPPVAALGDRVRIESPVPGADGS